MLFHRPPSIEGSAQPPVPSGAAQHILGTIPRPQGSQLASWAILPSQKEFPQTGWVSLVEVVNAAGVREAGEGQMGGGGA